MRNGALFNGADVAAARVAGPSRPMRALLHDHARECAAWLLWTHRHKLRRGPVYIMVDADDVPHWLVLAADVLAARRKWQVNVSWSCGGLSRVYRLSRRRLAAVS